MANLAGGSKADLADLAGGSICRTLRCLKIPGVGIYPWGGLGRVVGAGAYVKGEELSRHVAVVVPYIEKPPQAYPEHVAIKPTP